MEYYLAGFQKYATFTGRARRKEYWMFTLFNVIAAIVIAIISGVIHLPILYLLYVLAAFCPGLAVTIRRLHDTGRSGWWILIALVPIAGAFILLYFNVSDSTPGPNPYGPNPKELTA